MNVKEIRDRIVELSLHGAGPDAELNARALGWLNSAYFEILDEILPLQPTALQVRETVTTDVDGTAVLAQPVQRLLRVTANGQVLALDKLQDGLPQVYANGSALTCPEQKNTEFAVTYVAAPVALLEDDGEAAIKLPVSQHSALVWGGLVWSALFERGFASQSDLLMYQRQWDMAKQRLRFLLLGNETARLRVTPFSLI